MNFYEFYKSELEKKKTISSKKAFLTKSQNQVQEYLNDLIKHKKPSGNMKFGYLYGEPVTALRISRTKNELKVIENLKEQLNNISMKAPAKKTTAKRKTAPKKTGTGSRVKTLTPAQKRKKTIARKNRQTGRTDVALDKTKKALRPGKRTSASGRTYYERRANRSDVGKLLAPAGQNVGDTCTRRNADGSTTRYSAQGGNNPCPYGGRPTVKAVTMQRLNGAKAKAKKKPTTAQLNARAEFTKKQAQARKLVESGKAKTMRSAWAMLK